MSSALFDVIPADRREAVWAALKVAFGRAPPERLRPVTSGGSGALIFRTEVAGKPYLLRLENQSGGLRETEAAHRSMEIAAAARVAPPVRYANWRAGVAIMDFLDERPLAEYTGGAAGLAREVGGLIARLQRTTPFPAFAEDYPAVLRRMFDVLRSCGLFADGLLDPHLEAFETIRSVYPWDEDARVSSHNDLHPGNFLFDGERLWLIDWETACRNDAAVDVAIALNYLAPTLELEAILLQAWMGHPPDKRLRARLMLMRALVLVFYAAAPNGLVATFQNKPDTDLTAPTPAEFWTEVGAGRLMLGAPNVVVLGRKVALRAFLDRTRTAAFQTALAILRGA